MSPQEYRAVLLRAKRGELDAQVTLGLAYATGEGLRRNLARARHWYRLAAGRGEYAATFDYATMVWQGEGGPADRAGAKRWLRKAAKEGSSDADLFLGHLALASTPLRSASVRNAAGHFAQAALRMDPRGFRELHELVAAHGQRFRAAIDTGTDDAASRSSQRGWRNEYGSS